MNYSRIALIAVLAIVVTGGVIVAAQITAQPGKVVGETTVTVLDEEGTAHGDILIPHISINGNTTYTITVTLIADDNNETFRDTAKLKCINSTTGDRLKPSDEITLVQGKAVTYTTTLLINDDVRMNLSVRPFFGFYHVKITARQSVTEIVTATSLSS